MFCRFKAFKNGEIVYTESVGSLDALAAEMRPFLGGSDDDSGGVLDRLAAMICSALTAPFDGKQVRTGNIRYNDDFASATITYCNRLLATFDS